MTINPDQDRPDLTQPGGLSRRFAVGAFNPQDPAVFTDPNKTMMLSTEQQYQARLKDAQSGHGSVASQEEAQLLAAGYAATFDGQLSDVEKKEWQQLLDERNGKGFLKTGGDVIATMASVAAAENLQKAGRPSMGSFPLGKNGFLAQLFRDSASGDQIALPQQPAIAGPGLDDQNTIGVQSPKAQNFLM